MSPVWSSQGVVLVTAMAVSATVIFLSLLRSSEAEASCPPDAPPPALPRRRSCLSSSMKKDGKMKKKVRFSENVIEADLDRKTWKEAEYVCNCGVETMDLNGARNQLVEFSR